MEDFEKLGAFYLGKRYNLSQGTRSDDLILYDAKDLTTHAMCVGMTGSGKTGLCLAMLEEAAIDRVPVIAIDPKGDVGNLLLAFPELRGSDFRPWIEEAEAAREGITPEELAERTATFWRDGLQQWGEDGERIERYRSTVDAAIYTPGSNAGLPISVLRSFDAPPEELLEDADLLRDRIGAAASGLLTLVGIDPDPIKSREFILVSQLLDHAWRAGRNLDLAQLIKQIQTPPLEKIGSLDLETFYPAKARADLAMRLNNLLASPSFAGWMEGEPLNIARLLHTPEGKPRLSILSIAHLSEAERMFFVTILLNEILAWVRTQSGTSSLRAILYMDEVFGYFPPTANPPSKKPMLTLLKQARAYGLGIVLATQNPVDLDYKGLSNTGTWFLGRLQTERDKARVLEGLEGASAAAGSNFNRAEMEATLAGLGKRVFLLNNVHEDQPVVFETRWCLSYLRGPLTRGQIQALMANRKSDESPSEQETSRTGSEKTDAVAEGASDDRAGIPAEIEQVFLQPTGNQEHVPSVYRPELMARARLHFVDSKANVDHWQEVTAIAPIAGDVPANPWLNARVTTSEVLIDSEPRDEARFAMLPKPLLSVRNYKAWGKELLGHLYRDYTLALWTAPALKEYSRPNETEGDFRIRVTQIAREIRDAEIARLREKYAAKSASLEDRIQKAQERLAREKSEFQTKTVESAVSIGSSILRAILGRKLASVTNVRGASSAAKSASRAARERADVERANNALEKLQAERAKLEAQFDKEVAALDTDYLEPRIQTYPICPRKRDIEVASVALAWVQ